MRIYNNNNQPNFTSIYKIENVPVKEGDKTLYNIIRDIEKEENSTRFFYGENPAEDQFINKIETELQRQNVSYAKFKKSVSTHNKNDMPIPDKNYRNFWIFTQKDKKIINKFYKNFNFQNNLRKDTKTNKTMANSMKNYKVSFLYSKKITQILKQNSLATETFEKLIKNKEVIDFTDLFNTRYSIIEPLLELKNNFINSAKKIISKFK